MPTEIELKYAIRDANVFEELFNDRQVTAITEGQVTETEMESLYYDTPAGALSSAKWALRLRREGDRMVAALKTPSTVQGANVFSRSEWEAEAQTIRQAIPALVEKGAPRELLDIVNNAPLVERCRVTFVRKSCVIKIGGEIEAELSADRGAFFAGGRQKDFMELELELKAGDMAAIKAFAQALAQRYALEPEYKSKLERALLLRAE